jgi:hypothetical protein
VRVLAVNEAQGLPADSASCPAMRGKSGTKSKPYQAWCSILSAKHRFFGTLACGPRPGPCFLRNSGRLSLPLGALRRTFLSFHLVQPSPALSFCIAPPYAGFGRKILTGSLSPTLSRTLESSASYLHDLVLPTQTKPRTACNILSGRPSSLRGSTSGALPCIPACSKLPTGCPRQKESHTSNNVLVFS